MGDIIKDLKQAFMTFMEIMRLMAGYFLAMICSLLQTIFGYPSPDSRLSYNAFLRRYGTDPTLSDIADMLLAGLRTVVLAFLAFVSWIALVLFHIYANIRDAILALLKRKTYKAERTGGVIVNVIVNVVISVGIIVLGLLGTLLYLLVSLISELLKKIRKQ